METGISNENLNDFNWKNKLEDVDSLAGETLGDKNAIWEKLHSRLRQKPRRIKAVWYWAAAACVLLAVILPWMTADKKQDSLLTNNPAEIKPQKATIPEILPSKENTVANISPSLKEKKKIIKPAIQTSEKKSSESAQKEEAVPGNFNVQSDIKQQLPIPAPVIDSSVETKLAVAPVKKKLKVIHINELGDPDEETSNMARHYEPRSFKLKLINQGVYTSPSLSLNYTGFNIFKTTIPPSN